MQDEDLVNSAEAAELLGTHRATVNRLAAAGRLATAVKAPGKRGDRFFRRTDVTALAEVRTPVDA